MTAQTVRPVEQEAPTSKRKRKWWEYVTHNCNVGDSKKRVTGSINEIMVGSEEEDEYEPTDRK